MRKRKSHLFGGRYLSNTKDVLDGKFIDSYLIDQENTEKIAFLISIKNIFDLYRL